MGSWRVRAEPLDEMVEQFDRPAAPAVRCEPHFLNMSTQGGKDPANWSGRSVRLWAATVTGTLSMLRSPSHTCPEKRSLCAFFLARPRLL